MNDTFDLVHLRTLFLGNRFPYDPIIMATLAAVLGGLRRFGHDLLRRSAR
jgi:hypothetical protein